MAAPASSPIDPQNELPEFFTGMQQLCDLLGVTPTAIRNYERCRAIPTRRQKNGYRFFTYNDVIQCMRMKSYASMGFTVTEAGALVNQAEYGQLIQCLQQRAQAILQEQVRLALQVDYLEELHNTLERLEQLDGRFETADSPGMYFLLNPVQGKKETQSFIKKWNGYLPFAESCARMGREGLSPYTVAEVGYCVRDRYAGLLDEVDRQTAFYYPPRKCLCTVVHAGLKHTPDYYSVIQPGLEELLRRGLRLGGDIMSILVNADMYTPWRPEVSYDYYLSYFPYEED